MQCWLLISERRDIIRVKHVRSDCGIGYNFTLKLSHVVGISQVDGLFLISLDLSTGQLAAKRRYLDISLLNDISKCVDIILQYTQFSNLVAKTLS